MTLRPPAWLIGGRVGRLGQPDRPDPAPPLLAAMGAILGILVVVGGVIGLPLAGPQQTHNDTLPVTEPITRLEVDVDRGAIEVVGGADAVQLERTAQYRGGQPE